MHYTASGVRPPRERPGSRHASDRLGRCVSRGSRPATTRCTAWSPARSTSSASPTEDSVVVALAGDPLYVGIKLLEEEHRLEDVRLLAPVLPRSKVVGIGRNYAAHAAEMGNEVPTEPLMFLKPNTSVVGPGDPIFYPPQTQNLHYEGELAVVIGRICRDVPRRAGHRRDLRLHDRQRRDRARPAEGRRAVHPGQGLRLVLPARARGSRPTWTRTTSPRAAACRRTSTATSSRTARPRT